MEFHFIYTKFIGLQYKEGIVWTMKLTRMPTPL